MTHPWSAPGAHEASAGPPAAGSSAGAPAPRGPENPTGIVGIAAPPLFPVRPLSLGEILGAATRIYRSRPKLVLGLAATILGISYLLQTLLAGVSIMPSIGALQVALDDPEAESSATFSGAEITATLTASLASLIVSLFATAMVTCALAVIAVGEATGRAASAAEARRAALRRGPIAGAASLLLATAAAAAMAVLIGLGALPLILGAGVHAWSIVLLVLSVLLALGVAIALWARSVLVIPVIALERRGPIAGIVRSFALTRGRLVWRPAGISLLIGVIVGAVQQALAVGAQLIGTVAMTAVILAAGGSGTLAGMIVAVIAIIIGGYIGSVVTAPFAGAGITALYSDQRMRVEAWDIELAARAREARTELGHFGSGERDRSR